VTDALEKCQFNVALEESAASLGTPSVTANLERSRIDSTDPRNTVKKKKAAQYTLHEY